MSNIEWTERTWNPIAGCTKVSAGCKHCYAETMAKRLAGMGQEKYKAVVGDGGRWNGEISFDEAALLAPLKVKKPTVWFVNSMSDLFHEGVPFAFIDRVFDVIWKTPQHTYQALTKRPERAVKYVRERASHRHFDWTERGRRPIKPGDFIHMDDMRMRNTCGYAVYEPSYACGHPEHDEPNGEDGCDCSSCPIASPADSREQLEAIGVADGYEFDDEGFSTDTSEWMEIHSRPKDAWPGNLWLGFSAENQETYCERARIFRQLRYILGPHATLFVSMEPLLGPIDTRIPYWKDSEPEHALWDSLGPVDFRDGIGPLSAPYWNWVIVGGESGPGARPCNVAWIRDIVQQCKAAEVACFVKQLGARPYDSEVVAGEFAQFITWVNKAASWIGGTGAICTDQLGRQCMNGGDMQRARDEGAFPVRWHLPMKLKDRKGGEMGEWPEDLRVREMPGSFLSADCAD